MVDKMKIHREGYKIITFFFFLIAVILTVINIIFPVQSFIHIILYVAGLGFWIFIIRFFRSPERSVEINENNIYAPADGKIVVIEKTIEDEYFKDERIQVSIFMSAYNVHVNWYPISGLVKYFRYHEGSYIIARHPKSSVKNERTSLVIESSTQEKLLVRQIAGLVARRIVSYSKVGENVIQGNEMGFIKFGSRVDLFLPTDINLQVSPGQKVTGKKTLIASFE